MSMYIDLKYLNLISHRLQRFKKKSDYLWNFRCPFCGDSKKSQSKARGFVFRKKSDLFYKCHNCSMGTNLSNLIKHIDSKVHDDYILERYKEGHTATGRGGHVENPKFDIPKPVFKQKGIFENVKSFREIGKKHPAYRFIEDRRIPNDTDIFLCNQFYSWTNELVPNKFPTLEGDHPRMVIPFRDSNGDIFAYQGRAFGKEKPKYITIILDESVPKIFGLDRVDTSRDIFVVEGPIDSLFIPNCIAVAQSDLRVPQYKDKAVLVPDNEPRNKEVIKQVEKAIDENYRVVVWPDYVRQKDINDMILSGMDAPEIMELIHNNTLQGLTAKVALQTWKKI